MYRIHYTNHGYSVTEDDFDAAFARGKATGFEFSIWHGSRILCSYSVFGGITRYRE